MICFSCLHVHAVYKWHQTTMSCWMWTGLPFLAAPICCGTGPRGVIYETPWNME